MDLLPLFAPNTGLLPVWYDIYTNEQYVSYKGKSLRFTRDKGEFSPVLEHFGNRCYVRSDDFEEWLKR